MGEREVQEKESNIVIGLQLESEYIKKVKIENVRHGEKEKAL